MKTVTGATSRSDRTAPKGRLLTYAQAAERLGTGPRFPKRLVAERRIDFVKDGRYVRISEEAIAAWRAAHTVQAAE